MEFLESQFMRIKKLNNFVNVLGSSVFNAGVNSQFLDSYLSKCRLNNVNDMLTIINKIGKISTSIKIASLSTSG